MNGLDSRASDPLYSNLEKEAEESTCRICRGEGTDEDPLFYPCKCRGSIKYIHQGCLEEWLKRSGRDASCDICHQKYKFTTVYREDTPNRVPLHLILFSIRSHIIKSMKYILNVFGLVVGGVIQIPLFYAIMKRFLIWSIDGKTLHEDFFHNLIYGDLTFEGDAYDGENLVSAFIQTYTSSLGALSLTIAIIGCLFIEHEWLSRDPGFNKLVNKAVGSNKIAVADLQGFRQGDLNNDNLVDADRRLQDNLRQMANINRALQHPDLPANEEDQRLLVNAIENLLERNLFLHRDEQNRQNELLDEEDEDPDFDPNDHESLDEDSESEEENDADDEAAEFERFMRFNENERLARREAGEDIERLNGEHQHALQYQHVRNLNEVPDIPNIPIDNRVNPPPQPIQPQEQHARQNVQLNLNAQAGNINPIPDPVAAAANQQLNQQNLNNIDPEDFFAVSSAHLIVAVSDIMITVYLTIAFFFPSLAGHFILQIGCFGFEAFYTLFVRFAKNLESYQFIKLFSPLSQIKNINPEFHVFLTNKIIDPFYESFSKVYNQNAPLNTFERAIPLVLSYGLLYFGILIFLNIKESQHSDRNPLKGFQRKVYIILLDLICTLKVFLIFTIELAVFPAVCGLMLEFVCTPFIHSEWKLLLNKFDIFKDFTFVRFLLRWGYGTVYMCLFALFVGMTRRFILRPGVLFFIRSPEDPNARLIHDALVRPLKTQLNKIGLSGLVYTLFILIGFGLISYGLRLSGSPLLPIYFGNSYALLFAFIAFRRVIKELSLIKKYVRQYWTRAFKISSLKVRLSSFILGYHSPNERGYVKYKSLAARFKGSKPDYSDPKLEAETKELFRTTNTQAFFIPDGNLVRAPKNDIVSRKFVRSLFIPVTKDDIPLKPKEELEKIFGKFDTDEFDSEDEMTTTNNYEIVYRPPHFGARVIGLVSMLWVFAVILIIGTVIVSNVVGRPFIILLDLFLNKGAITSGYLQIYNDGFNNFSLRLEAASIFMGMSILISGLKAYDSWLTKRYLNEHSEEELDEPRQNLGRRVVDFLQEKAKVLGAIVLMSASIIYVLTWGWLIHDFAINAPYKYIRGIKNDVVLYIDYFTFPLHLIASVITMKDFYALIHKTTASIIRGDDLAQISLTVFYSALNKFNKTHLIVIVSKLLLGTFEYVQHPMVYTSYKAALYFVIVEEGVYKNIMVFIWPLVITLMSFYYTSIRAYSLLRNVNAEVKEQYYSRGKTLENTHVEDNNSVE